MYSSKGVLARGRRHCCKHRQPPGSQDSAISRYVISYSRLVQGEGSEARLERVRDDLERASAVGRVERMNAPQRSAKQCDGWIRTTACKTSFLFSPSPEGFLPLAAGAALAALLDMILMMWFLKKSTMTWMFRMALLPFAPMTQSIGRLSSVTVLDFLEGQLTGVAKRVDSHLVCTSPTLSWELRSTY